MSHFITFLEEASKAGLLSISDAAHSFTLNVSFAELKKNKLYNTKFAHRSSEGFAQALRDCGFNRIVVDDKEVYIFQGTPIHQTLLETLSATISPEFPACLSDENTDAPIPPVLLGQSVSVEENGDSIPLVLPVSHAQGQSSSSEKRSREGAASVNPKPLQSGVGLLERCVTFLEEASKAGLLSISDEAHSFTLNVSFAELKKNKLYNTRFNHQSLISFDSYFYKYRFRCETVGGKKVYTFRDAHTHSTLLETLSAAVLTKKLKKKYVRGEKLVEFIAEASKAGLLSISDKAHSLTLNVSFAELKDNKFYNTKFTHKSLSNFESYLRNYKFRVASVDGKRVYTFRDAHTHSTLLETLSAAVLTKKLKKKYVRNEKLVEFIAEASKAGLLSISDETHSFTLNVSFAELKKNKLYNTNFGHQSLLRFDGYFYKYRFRCKGVGDKKVYAFEGTHTHSTLLDTLSAFIAAKKREKRKKKKNVNYVMSEELPEFIAEASKSAASVNSKQPQSGGGLFAMQGSRFSFNQMLKRSFVKFLEEASKAGLLSISDAAHSFTLNVSFAELKKNKLYNTKFAHRSSEVFAQALRDCGFNRIVVDEKEVYIFQGTPIHQTLLETLSANISPKFPACLSDENTDAPIPPGLLGQSVSAEENGDLIPLVLPVSPAHGSSLGELDDPRFGMADDLGQSSSEKRRREGVECGDATNSKRSRLGGGLFAMQGSRFSFNQMLKRSLVKFLEDASTAGLLSISDKAHSFTLNVSFAELKKNKLYNTKFAHRSSEDFAQTLGGCGFNRIVVDDKELYIFQGIPIHKTLLETLSATINADYPACLSEENTGAPIPPVLLGQSVSAEENGDVIPLVLPVSPAHNSSLLGGPDNLEQSLSSEERSREGAAPVNSNRLPSGVGLFAMQRVLPSSSSTLDDYEQVFDI